MRIALLAGKLLLWSYLLYILWFLATSYDPSDPAGFDPPFLLFVLDWVTLFIHEAGHLVFSLLGQWMHMIGGSVFQVLVPMALTIVSFRQNPSHTPLPLFWTGESMVNLSVYIADAPYRQLKLIAKGLIHDWNWLLSDNLEAAGPLSDAVFGLGIALCVAAIGGGVYFAVRTFRDGTPVAMPE
ncbi:MAG: hypothetical protein H6Q29_524 [Bacteroidetes bacterium]|nr:hypothetical protein [Bacteroidota bacterium]